MNLVLIVFFTLLGAAFFGKIPLEHRRCAGSGHDVLSSI